MQKITPFLWFDHQAEEAVNFYISVFKSGKINRIVRYGEAGPGPSGSVMTIGFELAGQSFTALNGGPRFTFNEAISFVVDCKSQAEIDELWEALSEGGEKRPCGWLRDKFGLSWQIVPLVLVEMLSDSDPAKTQRFMAAMMQMTRLDIAALRRAYDGPSQ